MDTETSSPKKVPWTKGKIVGQKAPLKLKDIWAIRIRLQLGHRTKELALFDLGLDSKLRACDLVRLRVRDICHGDRVSPRAIIMQQKKPPDPFSLKFHSQPGMPLQHGSRKRPWQTTTFCFSAEFMSRRTKASLSYRRTKKIRAVQLLLAHNELESTVRHLGIEVEDDLELSEQTEI